MIQGKKILLRPVKRTDFEHLYANENAAFDENGFNNFGMRNGSYLDARFAENGMLGSDFGALIVATLNDDFAGTVSYRKVGYGPRETSSAYSIGIELNRDHRGKGYGVEAQSLIAEYLFKTYPIMRVEASTDIENIVEQRALEKANFTREGVIRGAQWRDGVWHDLVLYSKLRGE